MESVDESGKYIFKIQRHWIAVFRVAVDLHFMGENDYKGFCKWIDTIHPGAFRVKLTQGNLKQISNSDCYMKPFCFISVWCMCAIKLAIFLLW